MPLGSGSRASPEGRRVTGGEHLADLPVALVGDPLVAELAQGPVLEDP